MAERSRTSRPETTRRRTRRQVRAAPAALALVFALSVVAPPAAAGDDSAPGGLPPDPGKVAPRLVRDAAGAVTVDRSPIRLCPPERDSDGCTTHDLAEALRLAGDGDTVVLAAGRYAQAGVLTADRVTIRAEPGAHLVGTTVQGKGALVIRGDGAVIEGLECSGIAVSDGNGACVRLEGRDLTLRGVHFHDSQQGLLSGIREGTITIENSRFERLGHGGRAHAVYVAGDALVVRGTRVLSSKGKGHGIKSRARRTRIENSVVASLGGADSRLIDVPFGGDVVIRRNVLAQGPRSANRDAIGIGLEIRRKPERGHPERSVVIEDNIIFLERRGGNVLVNARDVDTPILRGNTIVGASRPSDASNTWYPDRRAALLPPYPALPTPPRE